MNMHFEPLPGLTDLLPNDRRVALSYFDADNADASSYLKTGLYPVVIGRLGLLGMSAVAPQPHIGPIVFQSGDAMPDFANADNATLRDVARQLTRVETSDAFTAAQRQCIRLTTAVCESLLRFERDTFREGAASFDYFYDNETISPGHTRALQWHQHRDAKRLYAIRAAAPMEIIRDIATQLAEPGAQLLKNMPGKHRLTPRDYRAWEKEMQRTGLFFQPAAHEVVLITGRTWHRSHQVTRPTPSSFLVLAVS